MSLSLSFRRLHKMRRRPAKTHLSYFLCGNLLLGFLAGTPSVQAQQATREIFLMGTQCTIQVFSNNRAKSLARAEEFVRILEDTEKELSTWSEKSVLTALNRQPVGKPFYGGPGLSQLFGKLLFWVSETGGAFDPGLGSLIQAWGIRNGGRFPSDEELEEARSRSGMRLYQVDPPSGRITRTADVTIDCGSFGKGEALDRLSISDADDTFWLVDLGGQIAVKGSPPGSGGWEVRIAHPQFREKAVLHLRMDSGSLSTSGGSERNLHLAGRNIAHILDPRTGQPVDFAGSVTAWHESALVSDILSTALYVMGPEKGLRWAEARGLSACFILPTIHGVEYKATSNFMKRFMDGSSQPKARGN